MMTNPAPPAPPPYSGPPRSTAPHPPVLVATVPAGAHVLDRDELADLVHEALVESKRTRDAQVVTDWWDAVAAADLILRHVTNLIGDGED